MSRIVVCPQVLVARAVQEHAPSRLATLVSPGTQVDTPDGFDAAHHFKAFFNDIDRPLPGLIAPNEALVAGFLDFVADWDRKAPLLIHCFAGISRSTAGAYAALMMLEPERDPFETAAELRFHSPSATPNPLITAIADDLLGRKGEMVSAIKGIGRGADAYHGNVFALELG